MKNTNWKLFRLGFLFHIIRKQWERFRRHGFGKIFELAWNLCFALYIYIFFLSVVKQILLCGVWLTRLLWWLWWALNGAPVLGHTKGIQEKLSSCLLNHYSLFAFLFKKKNVNKHQTFKVIFNFVYLKTFSNKKKSLKRHQQTEQFSQNNKLTI